MILTRFQWLGLLTLQKNMILEFVDNDDQFTSSLKEDLLKINSEIKELTSGGIVDRRVADRRARSVDVSLEKRAEDRRTFTTKILEGSF